MSYTNDPNYEATRDTLIAVNEGFSTNIYFDTNGIPTTGSGVALLTAKGQINSENMQLIANQLGSDSLAYLRIQEFAQTISEAIVGTKSMKDVHTASEFMASEWGQAIVEAIGDVGFVSGSGFMPKDPNFVITISDADARAITNEAIDTREQQLDNLVTRLGGDPLALSLAERCILMDILYQRGKDSKLVITAVKNLVNGGSVVGLIRDATSARYGYRAKNFQDVVAGKFKVAKTIVSPIVLDLDGNGIETAALNFEGAYFDHDANGFAEQTGWVNSEDGILVRDLNGNGSIDSGRELFGSETLLANGQKASNGYEALAELDTDHNGQVDAQDSAFAALRLWKDIDGDGVSSANELITLAEAGVQSLATGYASVNQTDANGNTVKQTGTFTKNDGSTGASADIWFATDKTFTVATEWLPETEAVAALPDLEGFGNVYDLHQAMLRDSGGRLQYLVEQFAIETDTTTRRSLINQLLYAWVGVENIDPNSRGYIADARQLYVLEAFVGEGYIQGYGYNAGTPDTGWVSGAYLTGVYNELADAFYSQLMGQTHFNFLLDSIGLVWNAGTSQFDFDVSNTVSLLQSLYDADPDNSWTQFDEFASTLKLSGDSGEQVLNALRAQGDASGNGFVAQLGSMGGDNLRGDDGNNTLIGTSLGEALYANGGDDTLDGGAGNDYLQGGTGNDVYQFNLGGGQDGIFDMDDAAGNVDTVRFGAGITAEDITFARKDYDVVLGIKDTTDQLTLQNWGGGDVYRIERFEFADGTAWDAAYVQATVVAGLTESGTEGDDVLVAWAGANTLLQGMGGDDSLFGFDANDTLDGGAGNDVIIGKAGNDLLIGGTGIDTMFGGLGSDTYVVDDIADVIAEYLNEGLDSVESSVTWTLAANVEKLTLTGSASINATGNALANVLSGNQAANVLDGGAGDDSLQGATGNDTYLFGRGSGQDVVFDYDTTAGNLDTILIAAGLLPSDVKVSRDQYQLCLSIDNADSTTDKLTLTYWFSGDSCKVEQVVFANGTVWNVQAINTMLNVSTEGADFFEGTSGNDVFDGLGGDDTLRGYAGDDTLNGGAGTDYLYGGEGNDTYLFGRGFGQEFVNDYSTTAGSLDTIQMAADVSPDDVTVSKNGTSLYLSITNPDGSTDTLIVSNWFGDDGAKVEQVLFANGTVWDVAWLNTVANVITQGADVLYGTSGNDSFDGQGGNDTIEGYGGDDIIFGGDGSDVLRGGDGNDTLAGGDGIFDLLYGGRGNDTYLYGRDGQDHIFESDATPGNIDTVQIDAPSTGVSVSRSGNDLAFNINSFLSSDWLIVTNWFLDDAYKIEQVRLTDGVAWDVAALKVLANTPSLSNDQLYGTAGNDNINGLDGDDVIYGLGGDDTLSAGDWGTDTLYGGDGNDWLNGGNYSYSTLDGGNGNDTLDGSLGAENTMKGGMGDDTYVVNDVGDIVTEYVNQGMDTVQSSIGFALGANVENLTLIGTAAISATGNALDNVLTGNGAKNTLSGNAGNDILNGGADVDTMQGGAGDDVYIVDNTRDVVIDNVNEGTDTVQSSVSHTLAAHVENLTLTGGSGINATGNTLDNILFGNIAANTLTGGTGNDTLDGKGGADKLIGGAGNDNYFVDLTTDVVTEKTNEGSDTVNSVVTWTLGSNVENLTLLGSSAINAIGNTANNVLTGNSAVNSLIGNAGNDTLDGGAGNDSLTGGSGNDTYLFARGYGTDTVTENDATAGNTDLAQFAAGISIDQLWFRHVGNNLEASIIGTVDTLTIQNWYSGNANHVEQFKTADGMSLLDSRVDNLVQAMAAFAPPGAGQTTLSPEYQAALAPVIAANWQ